ncbi:CGLD27-like [Dillenia turbinata]|uniref:CGLD27-like n=1 Tax=Dillenia turbinata TaxID=194707 RepID=A0AAN8Z785_9MAGN
MWVKPPEVLARDRLLGSYKVKPVIKLLKQTLVGTGVLLDFLQNTFTTNEKLSEFQISKGTSKYNKRKEELLRLPVKVMVDDDLATAAAEAADGRPV